MLADSTLQIAPPGKLRPGVAIAGYFRAELGIGEAARCLARGLEAAGERVGTVTYEQRTSSRQQHPYRDTAGRHDFDVNVVCVNADMLPSFVEDVGDAFFEGRYTIGLWFWEVSEFPESQVGAFAHVDEVWVSSEFVAQILRRHTWKPVHVVPLVVSVPEPAATLDREALGIPDAFTFLFAYDMFSVTERKNPLGLIDAFTRAFAPGEGPVLVVKSINGDQRPAELELVCQAAAGRDDIFVIDGYLAHDQKDALLASCDCYVSLHRSEGFGLTMAEAMAFGRPVIATGYSGNLAFMDAGCSRLVDYSLVEVPVGCEPYPPGSTWAAPDLDQAAAMMRDAYGDPATARALGQLGRVAIAERCSGEAAAEFISARLRDVRQRTQYPTTVGLHT